MVTAPAEALFIALKGIRHDAHHHIREAWEKGVRHFIVSRPEVAEQLPESNILLVNDTLEALQELARWRRSRFDIPVIGITGSNGKTIVKEWLARLLTPEFNIVRSPKSYNSQVGVPLSVWQMSEQNTLGIFEAGISQPGEMSALQRIIRPDIGILTNIGPAHREGFSNDSAKLREKMRLFDEAKYLVCCTDTTDIQQAVVQWRQSGVQRILRNWSTTDRHAWLFVHGIQPLHGNLSSVEYSITGIDRTLQVQLPFSDPASIENALHCLVVMHHLGISEQEIFSRMARLEPIEMRLVIKPGVQHSIIVDDAYSNDLASLRIALQFARQQARHGQPLYVVLSDILQSGQAARPLWRDVAKALKQYKVNVLLGIGTAIRQLDGLLDSSIQRHFYDDTTAFLETIQDHDFSDTVVLVKGARSFAFERIVRRLEQKAHKTVLEVNLASVVHNLHTYSRKLTPGAKMMVMVKAAGYGSGAAELAKLLEFHKADYLGVAYADEGIELRQAGVQLPIMVMNPEPSGFDAMYRYRLEPEIYSPALLEELIRFSGADKRIHMHLKLDTGMHRLGFQESDILALTKRLAEYPNLRVRSVFSHLSASDAPQHDGFTHHQSAVFLRMYEPLKDALGYAPMRHICNTSAIARFPEYHFDMVRLGIGLYGIDANIQSELRVVNTLKATISQIKEVPAGDTVGYNRNSGPLAHTTRTATISIGYADGFLRLAGGGRYSVLVRGQLAPTIGNVCMDMTMLDISHIPEACEGDEVIIFGENPPVQSLATSLQTIPYEIFTNIADRVKRVYWWE